jgi:hypothetical protein
MPLRWQDYRYLSRHKMFGFGDDVERTIIAVAVAGGWLTRKSIIMTPVGDSADKTRGCTYNEL